MVDELKKAINNQKNIRYAIVDATCLLNEIIKIHQANPLASIILSRVVLGTLLMSSSLKNRFDQLTTIVNGKGVIGTIIADYCDYSIRATCGNPQFELPLEYDKDNIIPEIVGKNGTIKVIKDLKLKDSFTGETPIVSGEINYDLSYYLAQSEQIRSVIASSIKLNSDNTIKKAVGFMAQLMPNSNDDSISYLEHQISDLPSLTKKMISSTNLENFLLSLDQQGKILTTNSLKFKCNCSWETVISAVKALGISELSLISAKNEDINVLCEFCCKKYQVSSHKIKSLLQN